MKIVIYDTNVSVKDLNFVSEEKQEKTFINIRIITNTI